MRITICDDMQQDIDRLALLCRRYAKKNRLEIEIEKVTNAENLDLEGTDLLFLDIEMPEKNGIQIQRERELISGRPLIIFFTNYPAYSMSSHGTNVIGFLPKPVKESLLGDYLDKALALLQSNKVVGFDQEERYNTRQIQYIVMDRGCSKAVLKDGKQSIGIYKSIIEWEKELIPYWFIKISQSCLVNCQYIDKLMPGKVMLKDGTGLTVSRRAFQACRERYLEYLEKMARFA